MAKATEKVQTERSNSKHPTYSEMVRQAIKYLNDGTKGSSRQKITKYIMTKYLVSPNEAMVKTHIATAIKKGVANELIVQTKGTGASGSFKLAKEPPATKDKKRVAPKKEVKAKEVVDRRRTVVIRRRSTATPKLVRKKITVKNPLVVVKDIPVLDANFSCKDSSENELQSDGSEEIPQMVTKQPQAKKNIQSDFDDESSDDELPLLELSVQKKTTHVTKKRATKTLQPKTPPTKKAETKKAETKRAVTKRLPPRKQPPKKNEIADSQKSDDEGSSGKTVKSKKARAPAKKSTKGK